MNRNVVGNIFFAIIITISSALISGNYVLYDNIVLFIGVFIMLSIFSWFITIMTPIVITKESDEISHPLIENTTILHIVNIEKHYGKEFRKDYVEKCICRSTLFRIYNEDTEKGTYIQFICAKCNTKSTGIEFNWKQKV